MGTRRKSGDDDNQPEDSGWFGRLFGGFGFGDIFSMLFWGVLICTGLYFFAGSKWGQDLMQHLPDSWKVGLSNLLHGVGINFDPHVNPSNIHVDDLAGHADMLGMTADQVHTIFPTDADLQATLHIMQDETHSISAEALGNQRVIFRMMTEQPATVQRFLAAMRGQAGAAPNANMQRVMMAVKAILADNTQFATLFNDANRANTFSTLETICPLQFGQGRLGAFIQAVGMDGAAPNAALRVFLNSAIDSFGAADANTSAAQMQTAFLTLIHDSQKTPAEMGAALAALVNGAHSDNPAQQQMFAMMGNARNAAATVTLIRTLGVDGTQTALATLGGSDRAAIGRLLTTPATKDAIVAWANGVDANTLPENMKLAVTILKNPGAAAAAAPLLQSGLDPQAIIGDGKPQTVINNAFMLVFDHLQTSDGQVINRATLRQNIPNIGALAAAAVTTAPADMHPTLAFIATQQPAGSHQYVNLIAMHNFAEMVATNPGNSGNKAARDRSARVMHALVMMVAGNDDEFKNLSAQEVSDFFSVPGNATHRSNIQAFGDLLNQLSPGALPRNYQNLINTLKNDWRDNNGHGISQILADQGGAQFVLSRMNHQQADDQEAQRMMEAARYGAEPSLTWGAVREGWEFLTTPVVSWTGGNWFGRNNATYLGELSTAVDGVAPHQAPAAPPPVPQGPRPNLIALNTPGHR